MIYVYDKAGKPETPKYAYVMLVFSVVLTLICAAFILGAVNSFSSISFMVFIMFSGVTATGAGALVVFGIRAIIKAKRTIVLRQPDSPMRIDPENPIFTSFCPTCGKRFDYQLLDLDYRPWYPNGFIRCPYCKVLVRHDVTKNTFKG